MAGPAAGAHAVRPRRQALARVSQCRQLSHGIRPLTLRARPLGGQRRAVGIVLIVIVRAAALGPDRSEPNLDGRQSRLDLCAPAVDHVLEPRH